MDAWVLQKVSYLKKRSLSVFLKCNSTVYGCAYMYSIEYVFLDYAVY